MKTIHLKIMTIERVNSFRSATTEYAYSEIIKKSSDKIRLQNLFYKLAVDVTFIFNNGERITGNKTILAMNSIVFQQMFFGHLREGNQIYIRDSNPNHFRLFLDCLLDFEMVDSETALIVYPIADKYDVQHLKSKCEKCLTSLEISDKDVAEILKMGIIYDSEILVQSCVRFIKEKGIQNFFSERNHYHSLTPKCVETLLKHFPGNNKTIHLFLFDWAKNYIIDNDLKLDVRSFLQEIEIWPKLSIEYFNVVDLINYYQIKEVRDLYSETERISNIQKLCSQKLDLNVESPMKRINRGDEIFEFYELNRDNDIETVRIAIDLNGRLPTPTKKGLKYKEHVTCTVSVFYTDVVNKRKELMCRSVCKRKINYSSCIKFKFKEVLDGSLIKRFDSIKISYKFYISGVYLRSHPAESGQIFAGKELRHTRAINLLSIGCLK